MPPARLLFYFATAAGIGLSAYAIAVEPPPMWIAFGALFLYINICAWGVVLSRFSMFADVVTEGPSDARGVALTFDDGPDPQSTPQVLELLEAAGARATFFVIGKKAEAHPELIERIHDAGHTLGVHSYGHSRVYSLFSPGARPGRSRKGDRYPAPNDRRAPHAVSRPHRAREPGDESCCARARVEHRRLVGARR